MSEHESTYKKLVSDITNGRCVPIISNQFLLDTLFGSDSGYLSKWADEIGYPLRRPYDLARLAQFHLVNRKFHPEDNSRNMTAEEEYLDFLNRAYLCLEPEKAAGFQYRGPNEQPLTQLVADFLHHPIFYCRSPDKYVRDNSRRIAGDNAEFKSLCEYPMTILAGIRQFSRYLTTSPHFFLEKALERVGRTPRAEAYQWSTTFNTPIEVPHKYRPTVGELKHKRDRSTAQKPLVYHLFGSELAPDRIVLTEDDHLDFLISLETLYSISGSEFTPFPTSIKEILNKETLLLIGFQCDGWDLRVLLKGLIARAHRELKKPGKALPLSVAIQINTIEGNPRIKQQKEKAYEDYLECALRELDFDVIWARPDEFICELWRRLNSEQGGLYERVRPVR